ncbi:MAG: hypothetical protein ABI990_08400 [Actinomycetota bacterium]
MRTALLAVIAALALAAASGSRATGSVPGEDGCRAPAASRDYTQRVERALASGKDVWGDRLLGAANGPSFAAASRFLPPLRYAAGRAGRPLTASGVYYLPFTLPLSVGGARGFGLHVADGSEIVVRRAGGPNLMVYVGAGGTERYGSCAARGRPPALADGYLPILDVAYRDASGGRYREESFVGRKPGTRSLVSFIRVTADATRARAPATIRLVSSNGQSLRSIVRPGTTVEVDAAFAHGGPRLVRIEAAAYAAARADVSSFWERSLAEMPRYEVPESRVRDAERALVIEELEMTWRYSVGNAYEELSFAEALDVAQVMTEFGYGDVARQILRYTLKQLPVRFTNWRAGERLVAGAQYFRLARDVRYLAEETPRLSAVVDRLAREIAASRTGLLPRERYSSDIAAAVVSLHGQTLVWQGLLAMSRVWAETGNGTLAERSRIAAVKLGRGLRSAVRASSRRLPDETLFVPASLLSGQSPFARLTDSRDGSYWNLVVPYALASGFFAPHGAEATGLLRYMLLHGSRLLGLVRAGAYRLTGSNALASGTDQVYGVNVARFLADNDEADQLVLSLYGTLAAALTPGTYVAGEAASVTPLDGALYRTMYLPPNNDGAATLLETLRSTLVHETRGRDGAPRGLELAFATSRAWLDDGKSIVVAAAPTSFGPVGYSITRVGKVVHIVVSPPTLRAPITLRLRLRLPNGERVSTLELAGRTISFDPKTGTIDLSGRSGELQLTGSLTPTTARRRRAS